MPVHGRDAQTHEPRLVAEPAGPPGSPSELHFVRSNGRGVRLRQGVQEPRPAVIKDLHALMTVAGRLRPSAAAAPTSGSPKSSTGVPRGPGWGTNAIAANGSCRIR